ncbi:MAG: transposase, partial [Candidatus Marinimicrobia bacterium]|nr:transposase [Candidatus Neomarinimicrobiota bacterium]
MERYKDKYRIPSSRLQNWDYSSAGLYFITINTKNGEYYFGDVVNGKMQLSDIGIMADALWYEILNHTTNVKLGEFVVMPNHVHGILILNGNGDRNGNNGTRRDDACIVSTTTTPTTPTTPTTTTPPTTTQTSPSTISLTPITEPEPPTPTNTKTINTNKKMKRNTNPKNQQMSKISPKSGSVSRIVGSYKSAVSKYAHRSGFEFAWQERFYDHIIRDNISHIRITNY